MPCGWNHACAAFSEFSRLFDLGTCIRGSSTSFPGLIARVFSALDQFRGPDGPHLLYPPPAGGRLDGFQVWPTMSKAAVNSGA